MKKISLLLVLLLSGIFTMSHGQTDNTKSSVGQDDENIRVYYFHYTRRCATCQAVEDEAKKAIEENYAKQLENGEIIFISLNLEEGSNEEIAKNMGISRQSLIVFKGDKKIDLTNDGFKYARIKPEKMHSRIIKAIDSML